jgi:hypothetical protein
VENLIGKYQELEKQQIYFASCEELNDPMEGKRKYFWKGDEIVWKNLLKHYLLCLEHVILLSRLIPDDKSIKKEDIPIYKSERNLPSDIYRERIKEINAIFFSNSFVKSYLGFIISNPNKIYMEEMYVHLKILLQSALNAIFEVDMQYGLIPSKEKVPSKEKEFQFDLADVWNEFNSEPGSYEIIMESLHDMLKSSDAGLLYKYKDNPKLQSVIIEFPQMYLDSVIWLTFPKSYVACFMDNCLNSSIWGTYGVNHTGVCLKFKTKDEQKPSLSLKTITSYSSGTGYNSSYREFPLKPVEYSSDFHELDFFRNLGRLPIGQLEEQWYTDDSGQLSVCGENIFTQEEDWRKQYWTAYEPSYLKKLPVWSHERENRILLNSVLDTFDDPKNRLLEYKFEDLEGVIFGMKTPVEAKTKIIEIIEKKCKEQGRDTFDFYEIAYSESKNELYLRRLFS